MAGELSAILDHIEKISAARPRRRPADDARRRGAERAAPRRAAARACRARSRWPTRPRSTTTASPSRARRRMSDDRRADRRAGRGRRREAASSTPAELFEAYRARAAADDLNALRVGRRRGARGRRRRGGAARRRAARRQGPLLHRGRPEPGRLEDPRGLPPAVHGDGRRASSPRPARRCSARPTRTSSRWARRTRTPRFGPVLNPWDRDARPGRLERRQRRRRRGRPRAVGARHRHRRLDPPARRAVRDRRAEADLRVVSAATG